jgi:hypothetical protein
VEEEKRGSDRGNVVWMGSGVREGQKAVGCKMIAEKKFQF